MGQPENCRMHSALVAAVDDLQNCAAIREVVQRWFSWHLALLARRASSPHLLDELDQCIRDANPFAWAYGDLSTYVHDRLATLFVTYEREDMGPLPIRIIDNYRPNWLVIWYRLFPSDTPPVCIDSLPPPSSLPSTGTDRPRQTNSFGGRQQFPLSPDRPPLPNSLRNLKLDTCDVASWPPERIYVTVCDLVRNCLNLHAHHRPHEKSESPQWWLARRPIILALAAVVGARQMALPRDVYGFFSAHVVRPTTTPASPVTSSRPWEDATVQAEQRELLQRLAAVRPPAPSRIHSHGNRRQIRLD